MWLNNINWNGKTLSQSELLVLVTVPKEFTNSAEIMSRLNARVQAWVPKAGTVYPILHRLCEYGLLVKKESERTTFKRSKESLVFLSRIADPLETQISESINFYKIIIETLDHQNKLDDIFNRLSDSLRKLKENKTNSDQIELEPYNVPITFE